ncbi:MAG TPA: GNAT family N-acetyltransferase [Rhizomicrobium sp.]|jgi:GNAT superfamily N-acetyltransferase
MISTAAPKPSTAFSFATPCRTSASASQTYLALSGENVAGFHTLVVGEISHADAPERLRKGLARHPVPIMVLARLAVDRKWQGKGLGASLLKDALLRTARAADIAGIRAFAVHAKDDTAKTFYEHFDFIASPSDPFHLFLLMKDIRALLE